MDSRAGRFGLFTVLAVIGVPALALLAVEGALRIAGFGFETAFLLDRKVEGLKTLTDNPDYGARFFPRALYRAGRPLFLPKEKGPNTFRVFVVGESAALGDPQPTIGIPRCLQAILEFSRPDLDFEVVNAGMTAINSHAILPISKDCLANGADLLVVYSGNNEFVGPFGPASIFGVPGAGRTLARANIWAKQLRIVQLLESVIGLVRRPDKKVESWKGMEFFLGNELAFDDPRVRRTYENFRGNLRDICAAAAARNVPVILSNVAVNVRDCAPFSSRQRNLTSEDLRNWQAAFAAGVTAQASGLFGEALDSFDEAAKLDDAHAELRFRMGRCLAALGRLEEADREYEAALQYDTLRFRADAGINAAIRGVAEERSGAIHFVDAVQALAEEGAGRLPGAEFLDDHVHLKLEGNFVIARAVVLEILPLLPPAKSGTLLRGMPSLEDCAFRLGHSPILRHLTVQLMAQRRTKPPFAGAADEAEWQARIQAELEALDAGQSLEELRALVEAQRENVRRHPEDWDLRRNYSELLVQTGDLAGAVLECERIAQTFPRDAAARRALGAIYQRLGREIEAEREVRAALAAMPAFVAARGDLALLLLKRGERLREAEGPARALPLFEESVELLPELADGQRALGTALLALGRAREAVGPLERATQLAPTLALAHKRLGDALLATNETEAAIRAYEAALRINPRYVQALVALGDAHRAAGRIQLAIAQVRRALEIEPQDNAARTKLLELEASR
jgi:tetratricopeptide (TPR) repeat protein